MEIKMTENGSKRRFILGCIIIVLGITLIVVGLFFPFHFFLPAWTYYTNTMTIDSYGRLKIDQNYFVGGVITWQVIVSNVSNSTLVFYIEDSSGKTIEGPREFNDEIKFEFHPQETSFYSMVLDNIMGESKTVFIINWQYYYNILFQILGFIIFIVGIIFCVSSSI
jgi:hypothetical protein